MPVFDRKELPANSKVYDGVCPQCERTFFSTKPQTKYCSSKCRTYACQERKKEEQKIEPEKDEKRMEEIRENFVARQKDRLHQISKRRLEQKDQEIAKLKQNIEELEREYSTLQGILGIVKTTASEKEKRHKAQKEKLEQQLAQSVFFEREFMLEKIKEFTTTIKQEAMEYGDYPFLENLTDSEALTAFVMHFFDQGMQDTKVPYWIGDLVTKIREQKERGLE